MKSFVAVESCCTQEFTQWWLVSTSPFFDTNEPEQPPASRKAPRCTCPIHAVSGAKWNCDCSCAFGRLSGVHMPSAANAADAVSSANGTATRSRFIGNTPEDGCGHVIRAG